MSASVQAGDRMRADRSIRAEELHRVAVGEAKDLHERLTAVVGKGTGGVAVELHRHLSARELEGVVFRHAMTHAGAFVDARTGQMPKTCGVCGADLS